MKMLRNVAFLTFVFFTFTLFTPMFMQPKEAEADLVGGVIVGVTVYVTIKGIEYGYGWVRKKIQEHKTGDEHPEEHPTKADGNECSGSNCTVTVTSSSHHVEICVTCSNGNVTVSYFSCDGHTCEDNENSSSNSSTNYRYSNDYYDVYSWW